MPTGCPAAQRARETSARAAGLCSVRSFAVDKLCQLADSWDSPDVMLAAPCKVVSLAAVSADAQSCPGESATAEGACSCSLLVYLFAEARA